MRRNHGPLQERLHADAALKRRGREAGTDTFLGCGDGVAESWGTWLARRRLTGSCTGCGSSSLAESVSGNNAGRRRLLLLRIGICSNSGISSSRNS